MKNKKAIVTFIAFIIIATGLFVYIPIHNKQIRLEENYSGVVTNKYYKRGNALVIKTANGESYQTKTSLPDSIYDIIEIGDTIIKNVGQNGLTILCKRKNN